MGCEGRPGVAPPSRKPSGGRGFVCRPGPGNSVVAVALGSRRRVSEGAVLPHASGGGCAGGSLAAATPSALGPHRGVRDGGKSSWSSCAVRGGSIHLGGAGLRSPGVAGPTAAGAAYLLLFSIKVAKLQLIVRPGMETQRCSCTGRLKPGFRNVLQWLFG